MVTMLAGMGVICMFSRVLGRGLIITDVCEMESKSWWPEEREGEALVSVLTLVQRCR